MGTSRLVAVLIRPFARMGRWHKTDPYLKYEKPAGYLKARAQMMIGVGLFFVLTARLLSPALKQLHLDIWPISVIEDYPPLELVSWGLMYAAGIELAHMLFTDGPDEAVHPVILGLAGAILLILADDTFDWRDAFIVPALTMSIGLLFWLDKYFIAPAKELSRQRKLSSTDKPVS